MGLNRDEPSRLPAGDVGRATEERIVALLTARGVRFRVHGHQEAGTVAEAAARLPFPQDQYLKTLAFVTQDRRWILAALRGGDRIDYRRLATAVGVRRADLRQPSPDEVAQELDMAVGGVSPFPPAAGAQVIVDRGATSMETVYCGIGPSGRTLEVGLRDLIDVVQARVQPIAQDRAPSP